MMKNLQKLGKALMLPVAVLPIASILMGIGYALCPSAMQGGDIIGTSAQIGFFLIKAGSAIV
ncbi:MAG: PTS glucose transporter subunit IIBC, partial [Solobacterium sp.]|nr:PTS glucose transporter subunit IIBC [Solobacterium sp.]